VCLAADKRVGPPGASHGTHNRASCINSIKHFRLLKFGINHMGRKSRNHHSFLSTQVPGQLQLQSIQDLQCRSKACRVVIG
jgi:hypothetical protein